MNLQFAKYRGENRIEDMLWNTNKMKIKKKSRRKSNKKKNGKIRKEKQILKSITK